jgi:hypothetical protein
MRRRQNRRSGAAPSDIPSSGTSREHSSSQTYVSLSKFHVFPTMIRLVPPITVIKQRNTKARKSEILLGSPYKNSLQEKLREKAAEDGEKKAKCKRTL